MLAKPNRPGDDMLATLPAYEVGQKYQTTGQT